VTPLALLALALAFTGEAEVTRGDSNGTRMAFEALGCGEWLHSKWRDGGGRVVAKEELVFEGDRWVRYRLHRPNIAQDVMAQRTAAGYRLTIRQGDTSRTVELTARGELLAGPTLISHVSASLPALRAGKVDEFDYLIAEQGMVLRLRARFDSTAADGSTAVRLEAASLLLRVFVPPTLLRFDRQGELLSMTGRLVPQAGDAKNPQSLDGVLRLRPAALAASASRMQSSCNKPELS